MQIILIDAQTAAASPTIEIVGRAVVATKGLAGAETIAVNIATGITYEALMESGAAVTISATAPQICINGPGVYQFVKGVTAGATTLQLNV